MIEVTRFNGSLFLINPDMLLMIEPTPDTVLTLTTGEKFIVRESPEEITKRFIAYKRRIHLEGPTVLERQPILE